MSPRRRGEPVLGRTEYASGLRVVTEAMPGVRSVALGVWVSVGSRDERPAIAGASHFLEHLLFKGTRARTARDIAEAFDAVGGDLNAFTAKEATCYYCRVADRDLQMAVEYMGDMLQNSRIAKADVEAERQVILEEINMRDDDPGDLIHDLFSETLWGDHPLGRPVLGTRNSIASLGRDQIKRFYDRLYQPPHFVIAAAGNLRHDELCALLERSMETGPRASESLAQRARAGGDVPAPSGTFMVKNRTTEQAHICVGTNAYSRKDPERFAFGVLNSVLGGGMSSRLFQEVREKRGLVYAIFSFHSMYAETGLFGVYAGSTPARAHEVLSLVRKEMDDLADGGLSQEELERAKGHMKGALVLSLEDTGGRMSRIGKSEIAHGEILSVDELLERIDSVTRQDATRAAHDVFGQPMALTVIGPFQPDAFDAVAPGPSSPSADLTVAAHAGPGIGLP
ncbi:MAG: insulinase family protein [Actinobacteria bacterium]|nr:insulinase family protein [Actinomycetota bacterium]